MSDAPHEVRIKAALDLGLQVWRTTDNRDIFTKAVRSVDALVAQRDEAIGLAKQAAGRAEQLLQAIESLNAGELSIPARVRLLAILVSPAEVPA